MATEAGQAYVPIKPDLSGFGKDIDRRTSGAMGSLRSFAKNAAAVLGGAFAITKGVDFLKGAVGAASDLNETVSKARTIFGPAAADLEKWASNAATAFGQSKQQALDAAGSFGNLFVQLGIGSDQAAGMSKSMVELASDFASFHNANPADVIEAQTAAFRGEYDALQRFVPTINAAAVEQEALAMSGKKTTKELTLQEKALATQALMMKGAGDAAGDFGRTSDSLANKQRIMSAKFEDVKAKVGNALIPVMTALASLVADKIIPAFEGTARFISENKALIAPFAAVIGGALVAAFGAWAVSAATAAAATIAAAAPVLAIGAAIAALLVGLKLLWDNWDVIWAKIKDVVGAAWNGIKDALDTALTFFSELPGKVLEKIGDVTGTLAQKGTDLLTGLFAAVKNAAVAFFQWHVDLAATVVTKVGDVAKTLWQKGTDLIGGLFGAVKDAAVAVFTWFVDLPGVVFEKIGDVARALWDKGVDFVAGLLGGIKEAALNLWAWWDFLVDTVIEWIGDTARSLWNKGRDLIAGLLGGIGEKAADLVTWITDLPGNIVTWIGDLSRKLYEKGRQLIGGFIQGIKDAAIGIPGAIAGAIPGGGGSLVDAARRQSARQIEDRHSGGWITPSMPTLPGLRADERPAILQTGEFVVPRGGGSGMDPNEWGRIAARAMAAEYRLQMRTA